MIIAEHTSRDSGRMKTMAFLGMLFLPGMSLAVSSLQQFYYADLILIFSVEKTFFSMPFFKWIPKDSDRIVSPYLVIWVGSTCGLTALVLLYWGLKSRGGKSRPGRNEYLGV